MIRLYLKTFFTVIVLVCFILFGYYFGFSYFTKENFNSINRLISKGTFSYIQTMLEKTPKSDWASVLTKLQPRDEPSAKILPIQFLQLNKKDKLRLLDGSILFTSGKNFHFIYFLYYGVFESFALQRIAKSQFALQIMLTEPINQTIKGTMRWMVHIILHELNNTSKEQWPLTLKKLQITFDMPLKLIQKNSDIITNKMRQDLNTYAMAYSKPETGKPISTLYFHTSDPQKLLVIGPIQYSPLSSLFSVAQLYYFISFALASIIIVVFLTWLFSRNVQKIYLLTQKYSEGDFAARTKIKSLSVLYGIYQNIIVMGDKLKRLIQAQKNMTYFVAHEVRTPLSTMQLALDSLKKENNLSEQSRKNIASLQEDANEINKLISYFLLYHQSTSRELKLKVELINVVLWLQTLLQRYQLSKIKIAFMVTDQENITIHFDPNLLKHVVDNLITNALKFAKENVLVSLAVDENYVQIHIDDDGPGIPKSAMKNIFEPFATLSEDYAFGKHIGLGLAIAKSIVDLHKGLIIVTKSKKLHGARFTIQLPRKR